MNATVLDTNPARIEADPFVWDRDYNNTEQVRPYLADFMALRIAGTFYNADFKGKIPGLATSANEDTGIYLLQRLAELEDLRARTEAFIGAGGYRLDHRMPNATDRGTLVRTCFYMGGTGWSELHDVTVKTDDKGNVLFKSPRQRNWRTHYNLATSYLFMPNEGH